MKKALLVIDMQVMPFIWKDYGGKTIYNEENLMANIKGLLGRMKEAGNPVYYIMYTEDGESPRAEGKALWQVHPEIAPGEKDIEIVKYHADSFLGTELEAKLGVQGIRNIVLCGVQTEYCVDTTCRSAFSHGFEVELAADCHSTYDSDLLSAEQIIAHHNSILSQFAGIKPADQIIIV